VALARARPGKLDFASGSTGSTGHLAGELFKQMTGTYMVHIPYKGAAPATADLLAERVHLGCRTAVRSVSLHSYSKS